MSWFQKFTTKHKVVASIVVLVLSVQIINLFLFFPLIEDKDRKMQETNQLMNRLAVESRLDLEVKALRMRVSKFINHNRDIYNLSDESQLREVTQILEAKATLLLDEQYITPYASKFVDYLSLGDIDRIYQSTNFSPIYFSSIQSEGEIEFISFPYSIGDQASLLFVFDLGAIKAKIDEMFPGVVSSFFIEPKSQKIKVNFSDSHLFGEASLRETAYLIVTACLFTGLISFLIWFVFVRQAFRPIKLLAERLRTTGGSKTSDDLFTDEVQELGLYFDKVIEESHTDGLTQLKNRKYFNSFIEDLFAQQGSNLEPKILPSAALLLLDLDHFKAINDRYGHQAGDFVLKKVSFLIQSEIRASDVAFRYGGEELGVIALNSSPSRAMDLAERIRTKIHNHRFWFEGKLIPVTASIGVTSTISLNQVNIPTASKKAKPHLMISQADQALYQAKSLGRNRSKYFTQKFVENMSSSVAVG